MHFCEVLEVLELVVFRVVEMVILCSLIADTSGIACLDVLMHNSVEMMGLPFPPPYLDPKAEGPVILRRINYASGAGGIRNESGYNLVSRSRRD